MAFRDLLSKAQPRRDAPTIMLYNFSFKCCAKIKCFATSFFFTNTTLNPNIPVNFSSTNLYSAHHFLFSSIYLRTTTFTFFFLLDTCQSKLPPLFLTATLQHRQLSSANRCRLPARPPARPLARERWLWQGSNDTGDHYGRSFAGSQVSGFTATL